MESDAQLQPTWKWLLCYCVKRQKLCIIQCKTNLRAFVFLILKPNKFGREERPGEHVRTHTHRQGRFLGSDGSATQDGRRRQFHALSLGAPLARG